MKRFLTGILFIILCLCFIVFWGLADESYRASEAQKRFLELSQSSATKSSEVTSTAAETTVYETEETTTLPEETTVVTDILEVPIDGDITLLFGGDVVLDSAYSNFKGAGSAALCIDASLLDEMQSADIFMHGHVFALTDKDTPADKAYVFRASTDDASLLTELGTDIVSLANNHSFDHGEEGLRDTMDTLSDIGVAYVGAGISEDTAEAPHYIEIGGKRIAFTAAMRSEKYLKTPEANGDNSGVVKMYDLGNYLEIIRHAAENSDFVVAYAHWGVENTIWLEQEQLDGARAMIDAGADIVVGAHSHTLQTAELYNGKPIFYGLGDLHGEGGLAKITITDSGEITAAILPFNNKDGIATPLSGNELQTKIEELDFISSSTVSLDGSITE